MFRIRLHARRGQAMTTTARVLGLAFSLEGFFVQETLNADASEAGAPLAVHLRADRRSISQRGLITTPCLIVVADESLLASSCTSILRGAGRCSTVVVNSPTPHGSWCDHPTLEGPILTLPEPHDGDGRLSQPYLVATTVGVATRLVALTRPTLEQAFQLGLDPHWASIRESIQIALGAYEAMGPLPGSGTSNLTGRMLQPIKRDERCMKCWWLCCTQCPQGAMVLDGSGYPQFDYQRCAGCLVCTSLCPLGAIELLPAQVPRTAG